MTRATVLILHPAPPTAAGPLVAALADVRAGLAQAHQAGFAAAGADDVRIVSEPPDDTPFGARLRRLVRGLGSPGGLVVLGSGALPLATVADRRAFVEVAVSGERRALANDRWSADAVAMGRTDVLDELPDLETDNALPRWLAERGGFEVLDLTRRWRLSVDVDGPLDILLAAHHRLAPRTIRAGAEGLRPCARSALASFGRLAQVLADARAEVLVAGRTGSSALRWLERSTASRTRALIEERGLRAASALATATPARSARPPASALGMLLDHDGPAALGPIVARLADAALIDTRVLLAHRLGADAARWPSDEDRFASDLLRPDLIHDPWLRELTDSAASAPVPILLGGHTLVGPGVRLLGPVS